MEYEAYIQQLVLLFRTFAYVSMVLALLHAVHDFRSGNNVTRYIVYLICLTAFLAFYNTILDYGCKMFNLGVNEARENTFAIWDEVDNVIDQKSHSYSFSGIMEKYVLIPLTKGLLYACRMFHWFSGLVQEMFKVIYRISAPLAIGLAAWRVFISTGVHFAAGTLWLCAWSVGCSIADILLLRVLAAMLAKAVLSGTEGVAGAAVSRLVVSGAITAGTTATGSAVLLAILFALILFLVVAIMLYILMPIALYHIICSGDVVQGATHAMAGAIGSGMSANRIIRDTMARKSGGAAGAGSGSSPVVQTVSSSNTAGSNAGRSGGSGNTKSAKSHAALAASQERQLEHRKV